ncbi:MAG: potassium-transporting ATPase subunit KdpA [Chitinophagales bacterium]
MSIASPLLVPGETAISSYVYSIHPDLPRLTNPGYHGFSEMLYQYTSSYANNGSGFEGLGDNAPFWNITQA